MHIDKKLTRLIGLLALIEAEVAALDLVRNMAPARLLTHGSWAAIRQMQDAMQEMFDADGDLKELFDAALEETNP